jgi:hypothetical protein
MAVELKLPLRGSKLHLGAKHWGIDYKTAIPSRRVLALHGWLDNAATFDLLAPIIAAAGYCFVALDLAGNKKCPILEQVLTLTSESDTHIFLSSMYALCSGHGKSDHRCLRFCICDSSIRHKY